MSIFLCPLLPFYTLLILTFKDLDYVLIRVDESCLQSKGIKPILTDKSSLPVVKANDTVYIIQHPAGMRKHFSQDTVRRVNKPFIEYYPDTLKGSSGSPVFVWNKSKKFSLVALHSKGVLSQYQTDNWNKGVLLADILDHLHTGKGRNYFISVFT
jgi:V8-like Glu-specific endopeptidase